MHFFSTVFARLSAQCGLRLGNFSEVGVLAIFHFTAPLNDCLSERNISYPPCTKRDTAWYLREASRIPFLQG